MRITKWHPYKSREEQRFAEYLEQQRLVGEIRQWRYEPRQFILARRCVYWPDFEVVTLEGDIHYFETKGWHRNLYVSRNKWKMAAQKFSMFRWFWVTWDRHKGWRFEEYKPLDELEGRRRYP